MRGFIKVGIRSCAKYVHTIYDNSSRRIVVSLNVDFWKRNLNLKRQLTRTKYDPRVEKVLTESFFLLIKPQKVKTFQVDVGNMSDQRQRQVDRKKMK